MIGVPQPAMEEVIRELRSYRYRWSDERDLQRGLERALQAMGEKRLMLGPFPERWLGKSGKIDFLVAVDGVRVGIEAKVGGSFAELLRQLFRYAESGGVDGLVVVSTRSRHASDLPAEILGIPVMSHLVGSLR